MNVAMAIVRSFLWGISGFFVVLGCTTRAPSPPVAKNEPAEQATPPPPTLVVVGHAKATAKPDLGRLSFSVVSRSPTLASALHRNKAQAATLIAAVKGAGIAERDIQTSQFGAFFHGGTHEVRNGIEIVVRDVERVGEVADIALGAGTNEAFGVAYELDEKTKLEEELRVGAMKDARVRAEALAKLGGKKLGALIGVSEVIGGTPHLGNHFGGGYGRLGGRGQGAAPVPFEPGELAFERSIEVVYAMTD
jgi:uncharacterized protein YggE